MNKTLLRLSMLVFIGSAMVCCAEKTGASSDLTPKTEASQTSDQKNPKTSTALALGVEIPLLTFADDVKKYMRDVLAAPIPTEYVLPEDIQKQTQYELAVAQVNEHFPEFTNLENEALLIAVKNNPEKYQALILEAKSVREMFFPGSQPKQPTK